MNITILNKQCQGSIRLHDWKGNEIILSNHMVSFIELNVTLNSGLKKQNTRESPSEITNFCSQIVGIIRGFTFECQVLRVY